MIAKIEHYENERGMTIEHRNVIHRDPGEIVPAEYVEFVGSVHIQAQTERGPMLHPMEFPIPGKDIHEAFKLFEGCARSMLEEVKKQQQQASSRIQVASQMPQIPPPAKNITKLIQP